jgi:hypothetical protein
MTRTPRNLTYFDFPLPPGGLSDAAGHEWMDGYARYLATGDDAVQVVFADNHMDLAAMDGTIVVRPFRGLRRDNRPT